ncbi:unnamed protein product [Heligmosomoides polygyrus]|uniref:Progestin and adipoQ receptor family member 6 n=1 Tax=Heligmosomoides polygyrus TaxID=6339 RepID=A0A183F4W2_HELPZ|nr:unnamed protein product [Heligmosomoides polygyrus]
MDYMDRSLRITVEYVSDRIYFAHFPGAFDLVGCSHQWWHVFILSAMVFWQRTGADLLEFYRMNESSCRDTLMMPSSNTSHIYS